MPKALVQLGTKASVFSPFYPSVAQINRLELKSAIKVISIKVGNEIKPAQIFPIRQSEVDFYFVGNDEYFDRTYLYGTPQGDYPDNAERFIFFAKAVLASLVEFNIKPDVIHCHDWQTALIPFYLKSEVGKYQFLNQARTIFTIHNLGYQGLFSPEKFKAIGVPDKYFTMQGIEFYGKVNFLKAGLVYADKLTTVSPTYAREIQTKEFGFGLEGVLAERQKDLTGILNGIDYSIWNPEKDKFIKPNYEVETLTNKSKVKANLIKELKLTVPPDTPVISFVGRLALQKGIELVIGAARTIIENKGVLIILGTGEEKYHKMLKSLKAKYPKQLSVTLAFNDPLAHRIYAGSDIFLMPSQYEPCGLGQMIAFKYGTIPIGFKTGGLADTIIDYLSNPATGNGFLFDNYDNETFIAKLQNAISLYRKKEEWQRLVKKAMALDFSWQVSAQKYLKIYSD